MTALSALTRVQADAIADRVTAALHALGVRPSALHLEEVRTGLVIVARIGDRSGACLVPPGYTVSWHEVAVTLAGEAAGHVVPLPTSAREQ